MKNPSLCDAIPTLLLRSYMHTDILAADYSDLCPHFSSPAEVYFATHSSRKDGVMICML